MKTITTDIAIIGGGPGGCATALKLSYLGIPSVLIEKASFPRDKVCGDAISGKVTTLLNRLDPKMLKRLIESQTESGVMAHPIWGMRMVAPNLKQIEMPFKPPSNSEMGEVPPGYVSKRWHFDEFCFREVQRRSDIEVYSETEMTSYEKTETGFTVRAAKQDLTIHCRLLIMANGAYSQFTRKYAGLEKDPLHYAGAVRGYYKNVNGFHPDGHIELHFLKDLIPGYFWVFPLPGNEANVGLGVRSDIIKERNLNLRELLDETIQNHPHLKARFAEAEPIEKVVGYGLPLGSKTRPISGDNFLLVGDAGHLIDPLTGEGIGNSFYSGFIAAELAEKCLAENNFSASFLKAYDQRVARVLGSEMKLSYKLQQMMRYPWILNIAANIVTGNKNISDVIGKMYTDFEVRKGLVKPWFWLKLLMGKSV